MKKPTRNDVIKAAKSQVSTKTYPRPNKYIKYYLGNNTTQKPSWCGMFVWYVFKKLCVWDVLDTCTNFAYIPTVYDWGKRYGYLTKDASKAKAGDLVIYDWTVDSKLSRDHIGIVKKVDNSYIYAIEGNTSDVSSGDGNKVQERKRPLKYVCAIIQLPYDDVIVKEEIKEEVIVVEEPKIETKTVTPKKTVAKITYPKYKTNTTLNLHKSPDLSSEVLCKVPKESTIQAKSTVDTAGWIKICYKINNTSITGYIRVKSSKKCYCEELK